MSKCDFFETVFDVNVMLDLSDPAELVNIEDFIASAGDLDQMTAAQIAAIYRHVKDQYDLMDTQTKKLSKFVELIKTSKLPNAFEREDLKTITLGDGTRVTVQQRLNVKVTGTPEEAQSWLQENGYPDAVKPTVNSSTLASIAREILGEHEEGYEGPMDLPDDIFDVKIMPTTSVVKSKATKV